MIPFVKAAGFLVDPAAFLFQRARTLFLFWALLLFASENVSASLESGFDSPPPSARPWVHWFWVDGNISPSGITADLEAMARVGIGGVVLMDVTQEVPPGDVEFLSARWRTLFHHALSEADRLGLKVSMNNGPGWTGSGGPWITPELAMQKVVSSSTNVTGPAKLEFLLPRLPTYAGTNSNIAVLAYPAKSPTAPTRIPDYQARSGMSRRQPYPPMPRQVPEAANVSPEQVRDISASVNESGRLSWDIPAGRWTVLRLGSIPTGRQTNPARKGGRGLESDKLSQWATRAHFEGMIQTLINENREFVGKTWVGLHTDSWEVGFQNWTPSFRSSFLALRGYDPLPFLPALSGQFVGNPDMTERFLFDYRRTVADLVATNYCGELAALAREHGLALSAEAYGNGPFNSWEYASLADTPMSEFWNEAENLAKFHTSTVMASVAHVLNKPIVAAEAFTSWPEHAAWREHPALLKPLADIAFCAGVNRLVFHRYVHQPWLDLKPGLTLGMWGIHYERTQTWWDYTGPWHRYLARCQFLLQQGSSVADVCYILGEDGFAEAPTPDRLMPGLPPGFKYEVVSPSAVLNHFISTNGWVGTPSARFRVLVLPAERQVSPALLEKLNSLLLAGAVVTGPVPTNAPGLTGYPDSVRRVSSLSAELWGNARSASGERKVGAGRLVWGKPLADILASVNLGPDFRVADSLNQKESLRFTHKVLPERHVYFVANPNTNSFTGRCEFRAKGRPEFWDAETGLIRTAAVWSETQAGTVLPIQLPPSKSVFIVFRTSSRPSKHPTDITSTAAPTAWHVASDANDNPFLESTQSGVFKIRWPTGADTRLIIPEPQQPQTVTGPWSVTLADKRFVMGTLRSLNEQNDPALRFFSGETTYQSAFELQGTILAPGKHLMLDLGTVAVMASVSVNQRSEAILWRAPFEIDITDHVQIGTNTLKVTVVNLWPNRMIGDEQLPPDCEWVGQDPGITGLPLANWPAWLRDGEPRLSGRTTFATRKFYSRNSPLLPSGLIGPVKIRTVFRVPLEYQ